MRKLFIILFLFCSLSSFASRILIPMDEGQKNHLKAYGLAFWILQKDIEVDWLLNYKAGSFMFG